MTDLVLHHYGMSPFSEKIRRILAFKRLPFRSVRAPAVMPKPDYVALTGGYRRVPILQIGADVYCDTALIARVLEARAPSPSLYPSPVAEILADWADATLFQATVPVAMRATRFDVIMQHLTQEELQKIGEDRKEMWKDSGRPAVPGRVAKAALAVHLARLDAALGASEFLCGAAPTIADFSAYHSAWFLESAAPEPLAGFENLARWMGALRALPLSEAGTLSSEDALRLAREAGGRTTGTSGVDPASGLSEGQAVKVSTTDYGRDPIAGTLAALGASEVVVRREDERAGTVFVHFPRLHYDVAAA